MVAATPVFEANWPSIVGASVSSTVTSNVALSMLSSPLAARWPSKVASVKPPAQAAMALTRSAPVISRATEIASLHAVR